jgi:hypothetical protein
MGPKPQVGGIPKIRDESMAKKWLSSLYENSAHGDKYLQITKKIIRSGFFQFGEWHIN